MKNLFFIMMAILLINVSYAGELGEDQKGECSEQVQSSRFAASVDVDADAATSEEVKDNSTSKQ